MLNTGWLSPTGEFIQCNIYDHISVAQDLTCEYRRADEVLMKRGYVQVSMNLLGTREWAIFWDLHHNLTPEQTRFLRPYFEDKDTFPVCCSARCRWDKEMD
jgi:hypothetical protein